MFKIGVGILGALSLISIVVFGIIIPLIRKLRISSSVGGSEKCQRCGKIVTEKLIPVYGDAYNIYVCKDCFNAINRQGLMVGLGIAISFVVFAIFMFYIYHFPAQIDNMCRFFERVFK